MRLRHVLFITAIAATACNSKPQASSTDNHSKLADSIRLATDTAGLAEYQQWKAQNELAAQNAEGEKQNTGAAKQNAAVAQPAKTKAKASNNSVADAPSGSASSGSGSTANEKKGWSKTAKGAVIGGAVGAGAGAIINKKNRAAGAVIGGAVGAGAGAVIGHDMDKKDGRH